MEEYDIVIVGTGAGTSLINTALSQGMKCALVERGKVGGTCLNRGCIPSKILVYPADLIREAEHAEMIGLKFDLSKLDWQLIGKRMWKKIDQNIGMEKNLGNVANLDFFRGTAEFTSKYKMRVMSNDGINVISEFKGKRFVLATGARSMIPPIEGLEETGYITSESFFGDKFPSKPYESLIIIGGGVIAAEFSHIFSAFGSRVSIVEMMPRLLGTEEPEVSSFVEKSFRKKMNVYTGHRAISARTDGSQKILTIRNESTGETTDIQGEEIMAASGLKSNADLLKVEKAGIKTDKGGWIITNQFLETSVKNIWSFGDANGRFQFRHKANYEADICENNIFGKQKQSADYTTVPWAIYTWPQVGHAGMTEAQAIESGHEIYTAVQHYSYIAKGFAMGYEEGADDDGFVKLVIDKSYRILGAHVVGPHAAILVQPFVYLMNSGFACNFSDSSDNTIMTRDDRRCPEGGTFMPMYHSMVIHPSLNELTGWAIGALRPVNIKHNHHG